MQRFAAVAVVVLALIGVGTVASRERASTAHWSAPTRSASASAADSPSASAPVSSSAVAFTSAVSALPPAVAAAMTGVSWRAGCPVPLSALRLVHLTYVGFDGQAHAGELASTRRSST